MIEKIRLKNWKLHKEIELDFAKGVNIIVGPMGSGKSSLLQAISFGLFGTFSELKSKDLKLADLVTSGSASKDSEINLILCLNDKKYHVTRVIRDGRSAEAIIRNSDGELLAGTNPSQVSSYLRNILGLDEELFLRTVYSKQNEIDLFLQLTPGERKRRLDQLMLLDKFEDARKNCIKLINKLEEKRITKEQFLKEIDFQVLKTEIQNLDEELTQLREKQVKAREQYRTSRDHKEDLEQQLSALRKKFEHFNKLEGRKGVILQQLNDFEQKFAGKTFDKSLTVLLMRITETKNKIEEVHKLKSTIKSDLEKNRKSLLDFEKQLSSLEATNESLHKQIERLEQQRERLKELQAKEGSIDELKKQLANMQKEVDEAIVKRQTALIESSSLQKSLVELESAEGVCPVCSSTLDKKTKEKLITERKFRIETLKSDVSSLDNKISDLKTKIDFLKEQIDKQNLIFRELESLSNLIATERENTIQISKLKGKRDALKEVVEQLNKRLEQIDEELSELDELHSALLEEKSLYELKDKYDVLKKELEEINVQLEEKINPQVILEMEKQLQDAIREMQEFKSKIDSIDELCTEKEKRLKELKQKEQTALALKEEITSLNKKIDFLNQFKNALLLTQSSLRQELVKAVNEVMNLIWERLYPYDKWPAVRLNATEADYTLQLRSKDGDWLPVVGFASGGERMLACLALRIAFAKVLAPNLNLLILDEPTHNLDDAAISTLIEVIQEKLASTLDQVFIVTHDEKLAEAGQKIIRL